MDIYEGRYDSWKIFADHHYLTPSLNKSARIYLGYWNERLVGCVAVIAQPSGHFDNGMRESRIVILPDFQGMGLGSYLSNYVAGSYIQGGYRYFSKTVNPALGEYREKNSHLWKPTSKNGVLQGNDRGTITKHNDWKILKRRSYCHEFINNEYGDPTILLHKIKN